MTLAFAVALGRIVPADYDVGFAALAVWWIHTLNGYFETDSGFRGAEMTDREFRHVKIPSRKVNIRDANGNVVPIRFKNLTEAEKDLLNRVLDRIDEGLAQCDDIDWVDDEFRTAINGASRCVGFVTTGAKGVGAYTTTDPPIVFLNRKLLRSGVDFDELSVTILHELWHQIGPDDEDKDPNSMDEARHDMMCYALLGLDIPGSHWAFSKYPDLLTQLTGAGDDTQEN